MKDEIKERLLKEIEELKSRALDSEEKYALYCMRYFELKAKLQQHEETSKAKDEEFNKILEELLSIIGNISVSDSLEKLDFVYFLIKKTEFEKASEKLKEIKQRIKENKK